MGKPVLMVNLDGVSVNFATGWIDFIYDKFGVLIPLKDIFHPIRFINNTTIKYDGDERDLVKEFEDAGRYERLKNVSGAVHALRALSNYYDILICTSRLDFMRTDADLTKREMSFTYLECIGCNEDKGRLCKQYGARVAIDDNPKYVEQLIDAGVTTIMFERPWNEDYKHEHVIREGGWTTILLRLLSTSFLAKLKGKHVGRMVEKSTKLVERMGDTSLRVCGKLDTNNLEDL